MDGTLKKTPLGQVLLFQSIKTFSDIPVFCHLLRFRPKCLMCREAHMKYVTVFTAALQQRLFKLTASSRAPWIYYVTEVSARRTSYVIRLTEWRVWLS